MSARGASARPSVVDICSICLPRIHSPFSRLSAARWFFYLVNTSLPLFWCGWFVWGEVLGFRASMWPSGGAVHKGTGSRMIHQLVKSKCVLAVWKTQEESLICRVMEMAQPLDGSCRFWEKVIEMKAFKNLFCSARQCTGLNLDFVKWKMHIKFVGENL